MKISSDLPVIVNGKLVIKTINGRNGAFNVGLLETAVGSFSVKDRELEQYTAGVYRGQFVIGRIFLHAWSYGANSGTEIRARLDDMSIETNAALDPGDEQKVFPPVNDPLDEENAPVDQNVPECSSDTVKPSPSTTVSDTRRTQFTVPTPAEQEAGDQALFGSLWPLGKVVKLDATASRKILRQQKARLTQLGYDFNAQEQHFTRSDDTDRPLLH